MRGVGRRFGGLHAVRDVDLEIAAGERRAILGPNGAGKTTLFNVICGDFPATSGTVELFGRDVTHAAGADAGEDGARAHLPAVAPLRRAVRRGQHLSLDRRRPRRTPATGASHGATPSIRERAREAARRVAIDHKLSEIVGSLSHGEQRQVALAVALAAEPQVMMLDEPCSGLSRGERQLLTDLLLALGHELTLIVIEHDMDVALRVAEQVTMMHDGRVIVEGTPDEIRANELVHDLYLGRGHRTE